MDFRQIIDENLYEYSDKIDCDVAEDLNRKYYRGLAAHDADDDSLLSLLIWEFKSVEDAADIYSGDTIIRIHRRTPEVKALSGKLFPNKKGAPAVAGKRLES